MNLLREVKEKVDRPFSIKLAETKEIIARHIEEFDDKVSVAFSGGKDSEVVLWLCLQVKPDISVVFNNTGVEHPETVQLVAELERAWNLNLTITHPEKNYWDCIEQYGFPEGTKGAIGKRKARCCYWLKEKPMQLAMRENGWLAYFTGETAVENRMRMFVALKGTCLHLKKEGVCKIKPILWWTEREVWDFVHANSLPVNAVYSKGAQRTGCMPCTAHKHWEQQMGIVTPKLYRIIKLRKDGQYVMAIK